MADAARQENLINDAIYPAWLKAPPPFGGYTYKEYKKWDDNIRVELLDGMVYMMASGDEWHQWMMLELGSQLGNQLLGKKCIPYVKLKENYEKAGVKEYWVLGKEELHVFIPEGGKYKESVINISKDLKQPISCLSGCIIDFKNIYENYADPEL